MIDIYIWKDKLAQDLRTLKKRAIQRNWFERPIVLFERELILIFFSIRVLIEAKKISSKTWNKQYNCMAFPNKGKIVDDWTKYHFDELFDLDSGEEKRYSLKFLTNQFVHAYAIFTEFTEEGEIVGVLLFSDREKQNFIIQMRLDTAIEIVEDVISDEYTNFVIERDPKTGERKKLERN